MCLASDVSFHSVPADGLSGHHNQREDPRDNHRVAGRDEFGREGREWDELFQSEKGIKMAAMHPAAVWLIIAAIVGVALLIASIIANRSQKKKKKGEYVVIFLRYYHE